MAIPSADSQYLECAHCHCEFLATKRQLNHHGARHYCSRICQNAREGQLKRRPLPYVATCPQCGKTFGSRSPKKFCSMPCYVASPQFKTMLATIAPKGTAARVIKLTGKPPQPNVEVTCLNCGATWIEKPSRKSRFCGRICYRQYMAKRFDRWMANPQTIALPQSFDEFLGQEELPCLVAGCDWKGLHLGAHVNFRHGISADEFKRAAGFNLGTGLVVPEVSRALSERPHIQGGNIAMMESQFLKGHSNPSIIKAYRSLEGKEHASKSRVLMGAEIEMTSRPCRGCGNEYQPIGAAWNSKFCSVDCRNLWYKKRNATRDLQMTCAECRRTFLGNRAQQRRHQKSLPVFCNPVCRQKRNARYSVWARGYQLRRAKNK